MTAERLCVHCRERPVHEKWWPFCSERCRLFDPQNWIDGRYRVIAEPVRDSDATEGGYGDDWETRGGSGRNGD